MMIFNHIKNNFSIIYYNIFLYKCQDVNCEFFVNYFLYEKWGILSIYYYIFILKWRMKVLIY